MRDLHQRVGHRRHRHGRRVGDPSIAFAVVGFQVHALPGMAGGGKIVAAPSRGRGEGADPRHGPRTHGARMGSRGCRLGAPRSGTWLWHWCRGGLGGCVGTPRARRRSWGWSWSHWRNHVGWSHSLLSRLHHWLVNPLSQLDFASELVEPDISPWDFRLVPEFIFHIFNDDVLPRVRRVQRFPMLFCTQMFFIASVALAQSALGIDGQRPEDFHQHSRSRRHALLELSFSTEVGIR
mmetsp:Transcript_27014/g.59016  ORF Transcript_27014/g.59016 Transcript_27014/m.59016 type:complete len:236 (-) Transcript_27014:184-891(-)